VKERNTYGYYKAKQDSQTNQGLNNRGYKLNNIAILWGVVLVLVPSGKTNPGPIVSFPSCTMHIGEYTSKQDSNAQIGSDNT
jgi:hypothetical protein